MIKLYYFRFIKHQNFYILDSKFINSYHISTQSSPNSRINDLGSPEVNKNESLQATYSNETLNQSPPFHITDENNLEKQKFLNNVYDQDHKKIEMSKRNNQCTKKIIFSVGASVFAVLLLVLGIGLCLCFKPKELPKHPDSHSTTETPTSLIMEPTLEPITLDPNTVENKVNESFYSYNFL